MATPEEVRDALLADILKNPSRQGQSVGDRSVQYAPLDQRLAALKEIEARIQPPVGDFTVTAAEVMD